MTKTRCTGCSTLVPHRGSRNPNAVFVLFCGGSAWPVSFLESNVEDLSIRPLFSGYPHNFNTELPSVRIMVVTRRARFATTHAHKDVLGSSQPPAKKIKKEATSATNCREFSASCTIQFVGYTR